jgi:sugar lactone lactonase YvrE
MRIEVIVDVKTTPGEGRLWDVEQERLYWIDSFDGRVFRATASGSEIRCWDVPQKISGPATSGPTITTNRRVRYPIGARSSASTAHAAEQPTARRSMRKVASGTRWSTTAD